MPRVSWVDAGNGERVAVIDDPENVGNYKALLVRPWGNGQWRAEVNGGFRGWYSTMAEAKSCAISFARAQIAGLI